MRVTSSWPPLGGTPSARFCPRSKRSADLCGNLPHPRETQVSGHAAVFGGVTTTSPPPSGAAKARLLRRAQAVARLRHPNLVRMLPLPGGAGLSPVIGSARRLADFTLPAGTFKRFDLEQVVRLFLDVLSGLAALHEVASDGELFVH